MRRLAMLLTMAAAMGVLAAPSALGAPGLGYLPSKADTAKTFCAPGTIVVNISYTVLNDADSGLLGNAWAADQYVRYVQVIQTGWNSFCVATRYSGSVTTKAGPSPGATTKLPDGITGLMAGGDRFTFQGKLNRWLPTSGWLGTFDYQCDASFTCPGAFDWLSAYFREVSGVRMLWWAFAYNASATGNGVWANRMDYSYGDITGSLSSAS